MVVIRSFLSLVAAALLTLALIGHLAAGTSADSAGFSQRITAQLQDPAVSAELQAAVKEQATAAVQRAAANAGVLGQFAAGLLGGSVADAAASVVGTAAFAAALNEWADLLHRGLSDYANGVPNNDVAVSGNAITVSTGALLAPIAQQILPEGASDGVSGLVDGTVTISTDTDLRWLKVLARCANLTWWLLGGGALALLLVVLLGRRRWLWAAIPLLLTAGGAATVAVVVSGLPQRSDPNAEYPAMARAVTEALLAGWSVTAWTAAAIAGAAGAIALLVALLRSGRSTSAAIG